MKTPFIFSLLFLFVSEIIFAQGNEHLQRSMQTDADYYSITDQMDQFYESDGNPNASEGSFESDYQLWKWFWENRLDRSDGQTGKFGAYSRATEDFLINRSIYCAATSEFQGNWNLIGPDNYAAGQHLGLMSALWIDPDDEDHILAGSNSGGLFETITGGTQWECITDGENGIVYGVEDIAVDPTDPQKQHIWLSSTASSISSAAGVGLFFSINGGATWQFDQAFLDLVQTEPDIGHLPFVSKLKFKPNTQIFFALVKNKIYRRDAAGSWGTGPVYESVNNDLELFEDIEFDINNSDIIYVTGFDGNGYGGGVEIIKSTNGGLNWNPIGGPIPSNNVLSDPQNVTDYGEFNTVFVQEPAISVFCNNMNNTTKYFDGTATAGNPDQWHRAGTSNVDYHAEIIPASINKQLLIIPLFESLVMENSNWNFTFTLTMPAGTTLELFLTEDYYPNETLDEPTCGGEDTPSPIWSSNSAMTNQTISISFSTPPIQGPWAILYYNKLVFMASGISNDPIQIDHLTAASESLERVNLSINNSSEVYAMYYAAAKLYFAKSTNGGSSWNQLAFMPDNFGYGNVAALEAPGRVNRFDFEVSRENSDLMYVGANEVWFSETSVPEFNNISVYGGSPTHADIRALVLYTSTGDEATDVLFMGCDGGVGKKESGSTDFININGTGLATNLYFGFANTEFDPDLVTGGTNDNGTWSSLPDWWRIKGGDGFDTEMDRRDGLRTLTQTSGGGASDVERVNDPINSGAGTDIQPAGTGGNEITQLISKPLFVHPVSGRLYVGFNDIYWSDNWRTSAMGQNDRFNIPLVFDGNIQDDAEKLFNNAVSSFDINLSDESKMYVAYRGGYDDRRFLRLGFHSTDPNQWEDITQSLSTSDIVNLPTQWFNITDVVSDPFNAAHVWVSFGGFDVTWPQQGSGDEPVINPGINRVYFSQNAGENWHDVSTGLPAFPVNTIVYQQGSDDILYAGTDVGVYVWVKEGPDPWMGHWECFSDGLPNCIITELDINRCAGKLQASTWGRSIWESDLRYNSAYTFIQTSPGEAWSTDRRQTTNFVVPFGNTLTINSGATISMARNTYNKVMPGAKLVMDNGQLTNSCGYMWSGVQVVGNPNEDQSIDANGMPNYQGMLIMQNGATIENAYLGALADEAVYTGPDYAYPNPSGIAGGGIIQIDDNSVIRNCREYVKFSKYHAPPNQFSSEPANRSYIFRSHFVNDAALNAPFQNSYSLNFISMNETHGIKILGNTWNGYTQSAALTKINAIEGFDADFVVDAYCDLSQQPCVPIKNEFNNCRYAIHALGSGFNPLSGILQIDNNVFNGNYRGIFISGINKFKVRANEINLTQSISDTTYGLYTLGCSGYTIEENQVNGINLPSLNYGFIINGSGHEDNLIYKNYFNGLEYGIMAYGENADSDPNVVVPGLVFRCNEFTEVRNHIVVIPDPVYLGSIKRHQGSLTEPADNLFDPTNATWHLYKVGGFSNHITYFHRNLQNCAPDASLVTTHFILFNIGSDCAQQDCPTHFLPEDDKDPEEMKAFIEEKGNESVALSAMIDGGDKEFLISKINDANVSSAQLKAELLEPGPYLSDEVMNATIERAQPMTNLDLKTVVVVNSPVKDTVYNTLEEENVAVANSPIVVIAQLPEVSDRDLLFGDISVLQTDRYYELNALTRYYIENEKSDSLFEYLLEINEETEALPLLIQSGDYTTALEIVNSLPVETDAQTEWKEFLEWEIGILQSGGITSISEAQWANVEANKNENTLAGILQSNLSYKKTKVWYEEEIPVLTNQAPRLIDETYSELLMNYFTLQPNPATDEVMISVSDFSESSFMEVYNLIGTKITNIPVSSNEIRFSVSDFSSGVYFFQLKEGEEVLETKKLVVD